MKDLKHRLKTLETTIKKRESILFSVYYKDGTTKMISPGEAIVLSINDADKIDRIEEPKPGNNGILKALCNSLLSTDKTN